MKAVYRRNYISAALVIEGATQLLLLLGFGCFNAVLAQSITSDGTLNSAGTLTGPAYRIRQADGRTLGQNLFHSFRQFNLATGESVTFESAPDIRNIITRVTGGTPSSIDGLIQTQSSTANLFLINPSGIVFGRNASLNVGGSFMASTASAIEFGNQGFFSASAPTEPSTLLTINPSALLFNQIGAGAIVNRSIAPAGLSPYGTNVFGLRVADGQRLALVGGDVTLDGGRVSALGGQVIIGGLAGVGTVMLNSDGNLELPQGVRRSNVTLNNAVIDTAAGGGGSITLNAQNLNVSEGSLILTGITPHLGNVNSRARDINLNATGQIRFDQASTVLNFVAADASGNAGDIRITADSLSFFNTSRLLSPVSGRGNAGRVVIKAHNTVSFDGFASGIFSNVEETGIGQGGEIQIQAGTLALTNGGTLTASLYGRGNAGNIRIDARDAVLIDGVIRFGGRIFSSGIFSNIQTNARGNGGGIQITAGTLRVSNQAELDVGNFGRGNAGSVVINVRDAATFDAGNIYSDVEENAVGRGGSIRIDAGSLFLRRGAELVATTRSRGSAGSVVLNIQNQVSLAGEGTSVFEAGVFPSSILSNVSETGQGRGGDIRIHAGSLNVTGGAELSVATAGRGNAGNIIINANDVRFDGTGRGGRNVSSGRSAVFSGAIGDGGDIRIHATSLALANGAQLSSSSVGRGIAGQLQVSSRSVMLDQAAFFAETASGQGGDITLNLEDLLLLQRNSRISATAGTAQAGGNGGNININTNFIVADTSGDSDITANAFTGRGGNAEINAQGIFGIQSRPQLTSRNDITASSERGIQGIVTVNQPNVDPSRGLIELPTTVVDRSTQIAQGCTPRGQESGRFVVTGRGGLPLSPDEVLRDRTIVSPDWVTLNLGAESRPAAQHERSTQPPSNPQETTLVEADGFGRGANGQVSLVARSPLYPVSQLQAACASS